MITSVAGALEFSGKIGVGSILTSLVIEGTVISVFWRRVLKTPSEWQSAYNSERNRRIDAERETKAVRRQKDKAEQDVARLTAATDLTGFEERINHRLDLSDQNAKQQTEVLQGLLARLEQLDKSSS